ncbi:MAG: hypothetical protein IIB65_08595 [Proteobacteria bacterium]|nr:hypothetical protein [Pseudomonadota bacterium]
MKKGVNIYSLIGSRGIELGIKCLGSLYKYSKDSVRFTIYDDGTMLPNDRDKLISNLPNTTIVENKDVDEIVKQKLGEFPFCKEYRDKSVFAKKLFDIPLTAKEKHIVFCDSDIKFFKTFHNLLELRNDDINCIFMRDYQNAYGIRPWNLIGKNRVEVASGLNSGLFVFNKEYYDLKFIENILSRILPNCTKLFWIEQTCWAALALNAGGGLWDTNKIKVIRSKACLTKDLIAGHFVTGSRGLIDYVTIDQKRYNDTKGIKINHIQKLTMRKFIRTEISRIIRIYKQKSR